MHRLSLVLALSLASTALSAQVSTAKDTSSSGEPPWRHRIVYGEGPSVGTPVSDFSGATPPSQWCLRATRRPPGDFGISGGTWDATSRSWLTDILADTTDFGAGWRQRLGGLPFATPTDSIVQIFDESRCHEIATLLNTQVLGWKVGPPPVVVYSLGATLLAFPSNARFGEWGLVVALTLDGVIQAAVLW